MTDVVDTALADLAEKSAGLTLAGVGVNQQAKDLGTTRTVILSLKKHPRYAEVLMKAAEEGKLQLKAGLSGLVPELIACLGSAIKEGGKDGVRAAAIAAGILTDKTVDNEQKQAQNITVVLPGSTPPTKPENPV